MNNLFPGGGGGGGGAGFPFNPYGLPPFYPFQGEFTNVRAVLLCPITILIDWNNTMQVYSLENIDVFTHNAPKVMHRGVSTPFVCSE